MLSVLLPVPEENLLYDVYTRTTTCFTQHKFFTPRYKYETSVSHNAVSNSSEGALPCHTNHSETAADESLDLVTRTGAVLSEPGDYVRWTRLHFHCSAPIITMLCHPQPARNQLARLCGSTCSLGTCCVVLERLPSCHWVSLTWMTSPEKRTLHSICVGSLFTCGHFFLFWLFFTLVLASVII